MDAFLNIAVDLVLAGGKGAIPLIALLAVLIAAVVLFFFRKEGRAVKMGAFVLVLACFVGLGFSVIKRPEALTPPDLRLQPDDLSPPYFPLPDPLRPEPKPSPRGGENHRAKVAEVRNDILKAYAAYGEMHVTRREAPLLGHFEGAALEGLKNGVLRSLQYSITDESYTGIRVDHFDIRSAEFPSAQRPTTHVEATAAYTLLKREYGGCFELSSGNYRIDMDLVQRGTSWVTYDFATEPIEYQKRSVPCEPGS